MVNYTLYRIGQAIALTLPLRCAYAVAIFFAAVHSVFAVQDRKAVRENLQAIFPDKSSREIAGISRRMKYNFAKYLVDFFRFEKLDNEYISRNIRIINKHYLDTELQKGKGIITLTAHIGNWELGGVVVALLGYPFWAVALPHKDKRVNDFFNAQRQSKGIRVIPLGNAVRQCLNVLKKNEVLALVGDRDFTERGIVLNFFGRPTFLPEGPAAFALKTQASIVPAFIVRNPDDSFTLRFEKPLTVSAGSPRNKAIVEIITQYTSIFEEYIRAYPDQWYMFRRFWITPHTESAAVKPWVST